ncbi:hypothetical protein GGS23DRAFT_568287 [Durotheca rogersii]|uniref:uncharacterized protein n=1 Tax=Durotheca rogersii TaxID=419775 RepID=UPI002221190D|nr:uncharacterized protein GGS23DRAFT_568287 [Durotheca rogersii]KAI5863103.1 hypothetical protein GGS23DRAFT_568287 [Durotheca rogersii]
MSVHVLCTLFPPSPGLPPPYFVNPSATYLSMRLIRYILSPLNYLYLLDTYVYFLPFPSSCTSLSLSPYAYGLLPTCLPTSNVCICLCIQPLSLSYLSVFLFLTLALSPSRALSPDLRSRQHTTCPPPLPPAGKVSRLPVLDRSSPHLLLPRLLSVDSSCRFPTPGLSRHVRIPPVCIDHGSVASPSSPRSLPSPPQSATITRLRNSAPNAPVRGKKRDHYDSLCEGYHPFLATDLSPCMT